MRQKTIKKKSNELNDNVQNLKVTNQTFHYNSRGIPSSVDEMVKLQCHEIK
jgi:hypothetical protein